MLAGCGRFGFGEGPDAAEADTRPQAATLASFVTAGATFAPAPVTLTIPPSPGTRWLVLVSAGLESSFFTEVTVEARYLVDGVEAGVGGTQNSAPGRAGPWQHFAVVDGSDGAQEITFELRDVQGGTSTMSGLEVNALPLPAGARYRAGDTPLAITAETVGAPAVDFPLGALDGDYAFLLLANMSDAPRESDVYIAWTGPAGEPWVTEIQQPREPLQSVLLIERATFTGDATIRLGAWATPATATIAYPRVLALPLAELAGFAYQQSPNTMSTTLATPTFVNEIQPTIPEAVHYQYIATARVEENCTGMPDAERGVHFVMGDDERIYQHATDNCAYETTYGMNRLFTSLPSRFAVGVSSGNGYDVVHRTSTQLLLALP